MTTKATKLKQLRLDDLQEIARLATVGTLENYAIPTAIKNEDLDVGPRGLREKKDFLDFMLYIPKEPAKDGYVISVCRVNKYTGDVLFTKAIGFEPKEQVKKKTLEELKEIAQQEMQKEVEAHPLLLEEIKKYNLATETIDRDGYLELITFFYSPLNNRKLIVSKTYVNSYTGEAFVELMSY